MTCQCKCMPKFRNSGVQYIKIENIWSRPNILNQKKTLMGALSQSQRIVVHLHYHSCTKSWSLDCFVSVKLNFTTEQWTWINPSLPSKQRLMITQVFINAYLVLLKQDQNTWWKSSWIKADKTPNRHYWINKTSSKSRYWLSLLFQNK